MRVCGCDCAHARLSTCVCICACDASFLSVVKGKTVQTSEGKVLDNLQGSEQRVEKTDPVVDGCTVVGVMTISSLEGSSQDVRVSLLVDNPHSSSAPSIKYQSGVTEYRFLPSTNPYAT